MPRTSPISELTGYMDFDLAEHRIQRLRIVTAKGDIQTTRPSPRRWFRCPRKRWTRCNQ